MNGTSHHVVVAGGGFAAAEALLALRALGGDRVSLELIAPGDDLVFRPAATGVPFTGGDVPRYDLAELCDAVGAKLRRDGVKALAPSVRRLRLASGATASYDAALLAVGARTRVAVPGALTFRDQRDVSLVAGVVEELRAGTIGRLVLAVPAGVSWSLPVYELALQAAEEVDRLGVAADVTVVTPERAPLEVFGPVASAALVRRLVPLAVRVVCGALPASATRDGLELAYGGLIAADRVIAVPALVGSRLAGVPSSFGGFTATDARGRVEGLDAVWAAGDMTTFPVKQGGIAAQQAERAAADVAAIAGAQVAPLARADGRGAPGPLVLRARLHGGGTPLYLRTELDPLGRPCGETTVSEDEPPWWPPAKVLGRHLTPWIAERSLAGA